MQHVAFGLIVPPCRGQIRFVDVTGTKISRLSLLALPTRYPRWIHLLKTIKLCAVHGDMWENALTAMLLTPINPNWQANVFGCTTQYLLTVVAPFHFPGKRRPPEANCKLPGVKLGDTQLRTRTLRLCFSWFALTSLNKFTRVFVGRITTNMNFSLRPVPHADFMTAVINNSEWKFMDHDSPSSSGGV